MSWCREAAVQTPVQALAGCSPALAALVQAQSLPGSSRPLSLSSQGAKGKSWEAEDASWDLVLLYWSPAFPGSSQSGETP